MVWLFVAVVIEEGKEAHVDTFRVENCRQSKVEQGRKSRKSIQGRDSVMFIELMGECVLNKGDTNFC